MTGAGSGESTDIFERENALVQEAIYTAKILVQAVKSDKRNKGNPREEQ